MRGNWKLWLQVFISRYVIQNGVKYEPNASVDSINVHISFNWLCTATVIQLLHFAPSYSHWWGVIVLFHLQNLYEWRPYFNPQTCSLLFLTYTVPWIFRKKSVPEIGNRHSFTFQYFPRRNSDILQDDSKPDLLFHFCIVKRRQLLVKLHKYVLGLIEIPWHEEVWADLFIVIIIDVVNI